MNFDENGRAIPENIREVHDINATHLVKMARIAEHLAGDNPNALIALKLQMLASLEYDEYGVIKEESYNPFI